MSQPTCQILANGKSLPLLENSSKTVALGDLSVSWGRANRIDQPDASTASFTVLLDPNSANPILEDLQPGADIVINANDNTLDSSTNQEVFSYPTRWKSEATGFQPITRLYLPRAVTDDPTVWDGVPRAAYGVSFTATVNAVFSVGTTLKLIPLWYETPYSEPVADSEYTLASGVNTITYPSNPIYNGFYPALKIYAEGVGASWAQTSNTWDSIPVTWESLGIAYISNVSLRVSESRNHEINVFTGKVVSAPVSWNAENNRPQVRVTAADFTTTLANQRIGDKPWAKESARARLDKISRLAGNLRIYIPPTLSDVELAPRDIDSVSVLELLHDIAKSLGALCWSTSHDTIGAYIRFENPDVRVPLYRLSFTNGSMRIVNRPSDSLSIDATHLLLDGAEWNHDAADLATTVEVRYQSDEGEKHYKTTDENRRNRYGHRALSVTTELTNERDAASLAQRLLNRFAPGSWTLPEATLLAYQLPRADQLDLLNATRRLGKPITIHDLAPWIPGAPSIAAYLDGGTLNYDGNKWTHQLNLTRGASIADSIRFNQLPPASFAQAPLTWLDLSTVGV